MGVDRRIDAKGRVTIPNEIRKRLGLEPGESMTVAGRDGEIVVRPSVARDAAAKRLRGCIDEETRRPNATPIDPLDLKEIWTAGMQKR